MNSIHVVIVLGQRDRQVIGTVYVLSKPILLGTCADRVGGVRWVVDKEGLVALGMLVNILVDRIGTPGIYLLISFKDCRLLVGVRCWPFAAAHDTIFSVSSVESRPSPGDIRLPLCDRFGRLDGCSVSRQGGINNLGARIRFQ